MTVQPIMTGDVTVPETPTETLDVIETAVASTAAAVADAVADVADEAMNVLRAENERLSRELTSANERIASLTAELAHANAEPDITVVVVEEPAEPMEKPVAENAPAGEPITEVTPVNESEPTTKPVEKERPKPSPPRRRPYGRN